MGKVPEWFQMFATKYPNVMKAYENFAEECHRSGPLSPRDRALVKLGIAAGSHAEGSVNSQVRKALDLGMQPDEIRQAIILATTAIGFPKMMAALQWAENILNHENPGKN
jgi:4-carboxymuconolactone decarboxylase